MQVLKTLYQRKRTGKNEKCRVQQNAAALEEAKMLFSYNANVNRTSDDSNDKSSLLKKQRKDQQKLIR